DGDNDSINGTLTINVDDDMPKVLDVAPIEHVATELVSVSGTLSTQVGFGADGLGKYTVEKDNLSSSLTSLKSNGSSLTFSVVGDTLYAKVGNDTIFTFTVNPQTGAYSFVQTGPLDHVGQVPSVGQYISVPEVNGPKIHFVGDLTNGDDIIRITNSDNGPVTWGVDTDKNGSADYTLTIPAHTTFYLNVGNLPDNTKVELLGAGNGSVKTVVNPGHGHFTGVPVDGLTLDLSTAVTIEDADGDKVALSGQLNIKVTDSVPSFVGQALIQVSEDGDKSEAGSTGVNWGADNGANRSLALGSGIVVKDQDGVTVELKSNTQAVNIALVGAVLVGYLGNTAPTVANLASNSNVVFTASVDKTTGEYAFDLKQPLDHTSPTGGKQYLDLSFEVTAKDGDNDTATGTVTVRVDAAGTIGSINYGNLDTGVFVNLSEASVTRDGQTVAKDTATDRTGAHVVGVDGMAGVNDAYGSKSADILVGGAEANVLKGNEGDDVLTGNDGGDTLVGGKGSDRLEGGAGDDTLVVSADIDNAGAFGPRQVTLGDGSTRSVSLAGLSGEGDTLIGGSDFDTVKFEAAAGASGFVFDRANSSLGLSGVERFEGTDGDDVILLPKSYTTSDSVLIEIDGGKGNDTLQGSDIQGDKITGGEGNDLISGLGGDDELFGGKGSDEIWGGAGKDTIEGGDDADKLYGNDGEDILRGGAGDDIIDGGAGADRITGDGGADTLIGGGGDDQFFIGGGSDTVYGNATDLSVDSNRLATLGESDEVVVYGNQNDYAVTRNSDGSWTITSAGETDALYGVEHINFNGGAVELDLTANVLVFNAANQLVGTFSTIQAGVSFADAGFTVEVHEGTYNEAVVIGEGITLKGVGNVVIDGGEAGPAITVNGGGAGQSLLIDGIDLKGSSSSVILVDKTADFDAVTLKNGDVTGGDYHGLFVENATKVEGIVVEKVNFSGNATVDSGAGEGPVTIYLYNGNVTFKDVDVSNPGAAAENGIQLRGVDAPFQPMGTVVFDNVDVTGTYGKVGVAIYNYTNVDGLQIVNGGLDVNVNANWHGLNIDNVGGTVDLSGVPLTVVNNFPAPYNDIAIQGTSGNETFTGDDSDDLLIGNGGGDLLKGGAGNDAFLLAGDVTASGTRNIELGDGTLRAVSVAGLAGTADVVQGGIGADVIVLNNGATPGYVHDTYSAPSYMSGIESINGTAGKDVILVDDAYLSDAVGGGIAISGNAGDDVLGGGAGSDTITGGADNDLISGLGGKDILQGGTGNDEIWGGTGDDTIDGGADNDTLYGNAGDDVITGGDGNDKIIHNVGDGNDTVDGGTETGLSNPDYDILTINGDGVARNFTLGLATGGTEITPADDQADILVTYDGANAGSVRADEIERVTFNLGSGGDTVTLNSVSGSAIQPTTIVINGGVGNDTIDLTNFAGSKAEIVDNGGTADKVKLAGLWTDYVFTQYQDVFTISKNGAPIATVKGIEFVQFTGTEGKPGYTMSIDKVVNLAPNGVEDPGSVIEAGGVNNGTAGTSEATGNVLANDRDGNFDTNSHIVDKLSVTKVGNTVIDADGEKITGTYGDLVIKSDGSYVYTLDNDRAATQGLKGGEVKVETFSYTLADNQNQPGTGSLKIQVTGANDAPVAADDTYSTQEDTPLQVPFTNGVLLNDMDVDGDAINAMLETNPAHGTLSFTGAGTFLYTPDANYNGPDSFTYKVYDANGEFSNTATVTINV
ncbi:beta strand repeat-containing protein, partial [Rhizobium wuzhouense]